MKYELAKKLKDAGFPQEGMGIHLPNPLSYIEQNDNAYIPTLSELVEACIPYGSLFSVGLWGNGIWRSGIKKVSNLVYGKGSTPEESVADLWLNLNKK